MPKKYAGMRVKNRSILRALRMVRKDRVRFERPRKSKFLIPVFREEGTMINPKQGAYLWLLHGGHIVVSENNVTLTAKGRKLHVRLREKKRESKQAAVRGA